MDRLQLFTVLASAMGAFCFASGIAPRREGRRVEDDDPNEWMRSVSGVFRNCEALVLRLAKQFERWLPRQLQLLRESLDTLALERWRAGEFLAVKQLEFFPSAILLGLIVSYLQDPLTGIAAAIFFIVATPWLVLRNLQQSASKRVDQVRNRLPYTLDLMALILEAGGGTLHECLTAAAEENQGHPLGEEMRRVVDGIERGMPPVYMLSELSRRMRDPDIEQIILAINTSESQGLSLKETLRSIAERLRSRQLQWMEKSAEEAKVNITWPAMVVMVGCLIIITAPMLLGVLAQAE
jgi:Flp pilus assembly protein TadB